MLQVGGKQVLHVYTFIVPSGDEVLIEFQHEEAMARFRLRFISEPEKKGTVSIETGPDPEGEDRGLITFTNWNRQSQVTNPNPVGVLELKSQKITLLASAVYSHSKYLVTVQFMLEDR